MSDDNFLMQLPAAVVKTLETKPENTDIEYQIFREFVVNAGVGASEVSITTTNTNEQFISLGTTPPLLLLRTFLLLLTP